MRALQTKKWGDQASVVDLPRDSSLGSGTIWIRAEYSSVNFKDALGATSSGKIYKKFPLIGGIDVAGEREDTAEKVVVTGCGLGESSDGGFAEFVRVPEDWVVPLPAGLTTREAMCLGTAGFTAALCIERFEQNGQVPEQGPILVTGASGGVGMLAIQMLSQLGFEVHALSGKPDVYDLLQELGAQQILTPSSFSLGSKPLEKAEYAGAIDNVGGEVLAALTRKVDLWGNIACVGLAAGFALETTVMPFILRGVSLLGISSTNTPMPWRKKIWGRLASDLKPKHLDKIVTANLSLEDLPDFFPKMLGRKTYGRSIVKL